MRSCFAAPLAQVHRATFKGKQVVLKVQRPNIVEVTEVDMDILHSVAQLAERYSHQVYLFNVLGLVEEFAQQIKKELDFRMEVNNMQRFARNFAGDKTVHIPEIYPELCTQRVITIKLVTSGYKFFHSSLKHTSLQKDPSLASSASSS